MGLMRLEIHKTIPCRLPQSRLRHLVEAAPKLSKRRLPFQELSLVVTSTREVRSLNRLYRQKDEPTDVLSFDYGEIIICLPFVNKQAREHGVSVADEIALLFTHGLLHILGFDHKKAKDKKKMAEAERRLLGQSGLVVRSRDKVIIQKAEGKSPILKSKAY